MKKMKKMKKIVSFLVAVLCVVAVNAQTVDRSIRPSAAPAKAINIKDAEVFTLKNGLKVFLVEDKATPLMYFSLQLDVKPTLEGDKAGMSAMFGEVFGKMTKNRTKEQLNRDIDMISLKGGVHRNGGYAYFLKKYQNQGLDIMTDMLFNPVFSQDEFNLGMDKYKTALSSLGDNVSQINKRVTSVLINGKGFPDGEIETEESLSHISLADLENYYNTYFAPNVSRLVIVGNISKKDAEKVAEKYFGDWKKKEVPVAEYVIPSAPESRKVAFINKAGAVQSAINLCYPVQYNVKESDYDAAAVMSQILGGSGTGHLFMNLREDKSWTYGIYTDLSQGEQIGSMSLYDGRGGAASIKAEATDAAVLEVIKEFQRMKDEPVSESELKDAVTYRAGNFSRSLAESETMARFAVNIDKYDLPKDYYKNYLKRLEALTPADIQAAAKKYLKPENAWIVVTADKQYAEGLSAFAADGKVQWYDYNANPVEHLEVQEVNISAEQIIDNYVKALGGKEAIDKINDYKIQGFMEMMGQSISVEQYFKSPNLSSTIMSMQGTTIQKIAFDGKTLRMSGMQGEEEFTEGAEFETMKNGAGICPEMNYIANGYTLSVVGIEKINGSDAYILKADKNGAVTTEYYDIQTGLKVRMTSVMETAMGEMQTLNDFENYRELNGVKFPYIQKQSAMGQSMTIVIFNIEINKGIENSVFK